MNSLPNNIKELMNSDAYKNPNNPNHSAVSNQITNFFTQKYKNSFTDASGRNISVRTIWVWHAINDNKTCNTCNALSETIYESEEEIPSSAHHPNCRCWIEKLEVDDKNTPVKNARRQKIVSNTMKAEGGFITNPNKIDQPTNTGITQGTLDNYNKDHPNFNFPEDIKDLTPEQIAQIYNEDFYDERRINEIDDERIANAIFDMGVMSNFSAVSETVQTSINETQNTSVTVDGIMGSETINALNNIPDNKTGEFMNSLKENREDYLKELPTWDKYRNGWEARTETY